MHLYPFIIATTLSVLGAAQSTERFEDAACHVAFRHPIDWGARADTGEFADPCTFIIQPTDYDSLLIEADSVDVYTIYLQVLDGAPDSVAEYAGFAHRDDGWVILGRFDAETSGSAYARGNLAGVTGIAAAGCYQVHGSYAGVCDSPAALVGTASRSVSIRGGPQSEDVVDLIVRTLEIPD